MPAIQLLERDLILALQAISNPNRLKLLGLISHKKAWPTHTLAELLQMSVTNASNHLKILEGSSLVLKHRAGSYVFYELNLERVKQVLEALNVLLEDKSDATDFTVTSTSSKDSTLRTSGEQQDNPVSDDGGGM